MDERVNYARPSIDVLFETAANAYREHLVGEVSANNDGSLGLRRIKELGGFAIVQDPDTAEVDSMPRAAIQNCKVDKILSLEEIAVFLNKID